MGPDSPASAPQKRGTGLGQLAPGSLVWEVVPAESGFQCGPCTANAASPGGAEAGQEGWQGVSRRPAAPWRGDTGPRGPALDPGGPPEGSLPLHYSGRTARPGGGASAVRRPGGLLPQRKQQGTPRGPRRHWEGRSAPPLLLSSAVSRWPARAVWATGARWDLFAAAGRPRRLQGPLGLLGAPPPLSCSVSRGARHRLQPPEAGGSQKQGDPLSQQHSTSWMG